MRTSRSLTLAAVALYAAGCHLTGEKPMLASNEAGTTGASSALQEVPGTQIRPAQSATPPPRADVIAGGESVRPYINDQLNSRLPQPLAGSPWIVRWQSNLDPEFP